MIMQPLSGGKTDLTTANFNLSGAYRPRQQLELRL